jgi:two-component system, LytTR family, response regulator
MIRALVIDDELPAREELAALLAETHEVEVVGKLADAVEALHAIHREKPDVIFLDVQMPVVSGFELLGMLADSELPEVVFVTAHDEFALRAFDRSAVDYLLKPVELARLLRTVQRLRQRVARGDGRPALAGERLARVPCVLPSSIKLVPVGEIELVRSSETGVTVVCRTGEYPTDLTLQVLETRAGFLRCHKQYLVNPEAVDELSEGDTSAVRTRSGQVVPVSRRYLGRLRAQLGL